MRKQISSARYIAAFIITALIFCFGLVLGYLMQEERTVMLSDELSQQKLEYSNLFLQYRFISELEDEKDCESLFAVFDKSLENLNINSERLQKYQSSFPYY